MASGAVLGLRFHRDDFLGGYGSFRRRLVRLGHIAFIGLGLINLFFAQSLPRATLSQNESQMAAVAMIVGGVTMPTCCFLTAWRSALRHAFVVPVASLLFGTITLTVGLARAWLGGEI